MGWNRWLASKLNNQRVFKAYIHVSIKGPGQATARVDYMILVHFLADEAYALKGSV